jgi:hypothetical protein
MSVENFYNNSEHSDQSAPSAATAAAAARQATDAVKAAAVDAEHKAATLFPTMPQGEQKPVEPTKVEPDKAAALYDKQYEHALPFVHDMHCVDAESAESVNTLARTAYTSLELPVPIAESLTTKFVDAGNRVGTPQEMTDEQHAEARTTMRAELTRRFGADGMNEKLKGVRDLLAKSPQLADTMVVLGLDVDIDTIMALAEHSHSLRARGRL